MTTNPRKSKRINTQTMHRNRQQYIENMICVPIVVNTACPQRVRYYDSITTAKSLKTRSRPLTVDDRNSMVEWLSLPYWVESKKEWRCIGQYADEHEMLLLNPMVCVKHHTFYKNTILMDCETNPLAQRFIKEYWRNTNNDKNEIRTDEKSDDAHVYDIAKGYLKRVFEESFCGINIDIVEGNIKSARKGIFCPKKIMDTYVLPYLVAMKQSIANSNNCVTITISQPLFEQFYSKNVLKRRGSGSATSCTQLVFDSIIVKWKSDMLTVKQKLKYKNLNYLQMKALKLI
eukprot:462316_1